MNEVAERFISNILGVVSGYCSGLIIYSFHFRFLANRDRLSLLIITSLIGLVVSAIYIEYKKFIVNKKSTKVRNEAVALVTHEMRTGLTSTSWAIQAILQKYGDKLESEDKSNLEMVLDSIHTTVMHSVNLLDISMLDISKVSLSLELVPLEKISKVFTEILDEYVVGAQKKGIKLNYKLNLDKEKQAEVDILRLRIILGNVLENAVQYTVNETKLIEVDISNTPKDIKIKVKDSGIGIPFPEQRKIFQEFYRASNARSKIKTGSGIGLYACAQYVKAHHGTIEFESKENEGTTFCITIPIKTGINEDECLEKV